MRFKTVALVFFATLLIGTFLGGCAKTGMDRSVNTSNSIHDLDSEVRKMMAQVDLTATSLNSVVMTGQPDLKKSFSAYSSNVDKLDKQGERTLKRMEELKSNSAEYFAEWEKQGTEYTNSEIRELSEARRSKLAAIYAQLPAARAGIKGAYIAYLADLKEIELYLSNDLTNQGVETITPVARKTVKDLGNLNVSLRAVASALDEINAELYDGKK